MNPLFLADFYKVGHINQYPSDTDQVWSNWTPRSSRNPQAEGAIHFGLRYFIERYLIDEFRNGFFGRPEDDVVAEYCDLVRATLGIADPRTDHIRALHRLGYMPIRIYSLPEGTLIPFGVPAMVITNTNPEFFWLPNYLETLLSAVLWKPATSATVARDFRKLFLRHAREHGHTDFGFVDWQGHDFSMRGMSGIEDAMLSGMGHLLSFSGTDTIPAIVAAQRYYDAPLSVGGSVPATEHSVMSAGLPDGEFATFERLLTQVYPSGIVSIVSDTWDLWRVLTDYIPRLKDRILARNGKIVIRPDSGDPVNIVCGDATAEGASRSGAMMLLADALGVTNGTINNGGIIYGDAINLPRADKILSGIRNIGLSPYNMVFGIGSYTYEHTTRDQYGFAMKATAVRRNGQVIPIFKDPVTDDGGKRSHKGIPVVFESDGNLACLETLNPGALDSCAFELVYDNGQHRIKPTFAEIRKRVRSGL